MSDVLISGPDKGLNALVQATQMEPREAVDGSYNVLYDKGSVYTGPGLSLYNMTTALNSGDSVLHTFTCRMGGTDYIIAVTTQKIFRYDAVNAEWDDITQTGVTMSSDLGHPVSYAMISHDDTDVYNDDDTTASHAYEHVVICDGGLSNIQRWAGARDADCADLSGSDDYDGLGPHRALQVGTTQNRLILISPLEYDTSSRIWVPNEVRIRWPQIGKLEAWSGTGSGAVDLRDTGGINVWSARLGTEYYVYQTNSIWNMRYVGGKSIFDPRPAILNLGLLSHHLLAVQGNVHYFVGSDYNVYAYVGGTQKVAIGDKIKEFLVRDLYPTHAARCWMELDVNSEWLWIFIVTAAEGYANKAYGYNLRDKSWCAKNLEDVLGTGDGATCVSQLSGTTAETGETYSEQLSQISLYDISEAADATSRYGDELCETSRTLTSEFTNATWCAGGTYLSCATGDFLTDFTPGDIVLVEDGSLYTNCRYGSHFYALLDVSDTCFDLCPHDPSLGISDTTAVPAGVPISVWTDTGDTYASVLNILQTAQALVVGTNDGYVYQFDASQSGDANGTVVPARHLTPIFDGGVPGKMKLWPGLRVTARKRTTTKDGQVVIYYRTSQFDTTSGWVRCDASWFLDATYETKEFWINRTSQAIQFGLFDASGSPFDVRELVILSPALQENR